MHNSLHCIRIKYYILGSQRALNLNDLCSFHLEEAASRHPLSARLRLWAAIY